MFPLPQSVSQNPVDVGSVDTQSLPTLSVLLPIMNEISTLCQLIDTILAVPIDKEIIIVDDGSTDGTTQPGGKKNICTCADCIKPPGLSAQTPCASTATAGPRF